MPDQDDPSTHADGPTLGDPSDPTAPPDPGGPHDPTLSLAEVSLRIDGTPILDRVTWVVRPGESWVVMGRNGSGKSTLVRVASLYQHPSSGTVEVLGERLGRTDVRTLRTRIGLAAPSLGDRLRGDLAARDVVVTARHGALEPWWHTYDDDDHRHAEEHLARMGCAGFGDRRFDTLSSGERQRVLLARTLMTDPALLLLDEPTAGLDLAGREELVAALDVLAADATARPVVLVTHHVEEVPSSFTHALLLRGGRVQAAGPIDDVLTGEALGECFGLPLVLEVRDGRRTARART